MGRPAPDFTLEGTDGPFTLSQYRGERVVLLFYQRRDGHGIPPRSDPELTVASSYGAAIPVVGTRRSVMVVDGAGVLRHRHVHTVGVGFATVADPRRVLAEID